jgi:hypothetical protein
MNRMCQESKTPSLPVINVRLCGSVPRSSMKDCFPTTLGSKKQNCAVCDALYGVLPLFGQENVLRPFLEPPAWAVKPRGETRLEVS